MDQREAGKAGEAGEAGEAGGAGEAGEVGGGRWKVGSGARWDEGKAGKEVVRTERRNMANRGPDRT